MEYDYFKIALFLAVIAAAATLPSPWMTALQAGLGGFVLGAHFERKFR